MVKLKDMAQVYESKHTKNISDLDSVSVDIDIQKEDNVDFPYYYAELDGEKYRVPVSVIQALRAILEENPNLKKFKVKKTGEGMETKYTTIPLG